MIVTIYSYSQERAYRPKEFKLGPHTRADQPFVPQDTTNSGVMFVFTCMDRAPKNFPSGEEANYGPVDIPVTAYELLVALDMIKNIPLDHERFKGVPVSVLMSTTGGGRTRLVNIFFLNGVLHIHRTYFYFIKRFELKLVNGVVEESRCRPTYEDIVARTASLKQLFFWLETRPERKPVQSTYSFEGTS